MSVMLRIFSLVAYLLIFLQGSMILLPFGLLLLTGVFTAEPAMKILLGLADLALVFLLASPLTKRTKWTWLFETTAFFVLLLPLLKIFTSFSFDWFNYFLFLFPFGCFTLLLPLSIFLEHRKFIKTKKNLASELNL